MKLRNIALSLSALVLFTLPTVDAQEDKPAQGKGWQTINGHRNWWQMVLFQRMGLYG